MENLLLDENFNLKIADFGFASSKEQHEITSKGESLGTAEYMAPEIYLTKDGY